MPRHPRSVQAGAALHVVQRGNNRNLCFFGDTDRLAYLRYLHRFAREAGCAVHAYCLMTNHVHLLLTPVGGDGACALLMKALSQHYVQHVNRVHGRTGTLWEGRYRSCVAASESYVLACYRYIELNPVRAGIVTHPHDYLWSSYRSNAEGQPDSLLEPHAVFDSLGHDGLHARRVYRSLVDGALAHSTIEEIRSATRGNRALGAKSARRGRPTKNEV